MTSAPTRLSRVSIATATAIGAAAALAVPASAAPVDYYLEIEGVPGESQADRHKGRIEIQSVSWGRPLRGGAKVATGDVNNDSAARKKKGKVESGWKVEEGKTASPGASAPGSVQAPGSDPQATGLLLPAIQKARATLTGNYAGCRVGNRLNSVVAIDTSGRRIVFEDVAITACNRPAGSASGDTVPTESVSFNYAKIK